MYGLGEFLFCLHRTFVIPNFDREVLLSAPQMSLLRARLITKKIIGTPLLCVLLTSVDFTKLSASLLPSLM